MTRRRAPTRPTAVGALLLALLALATVPGPIDASAAAASGDPLESAECQRALAALSSEEAAVAESSHASGALSANDLRLIDARLAPTRRRAARACLARRTDPASLPAERLVRPPPLVAAPLAVSPAASQPATAATTARVAPLVPPAAPAEKPYAITSCDSSGCWANDGSRLNRVGPNLWSPRGICTVQGSLLQFP